MDKISKEKRSENMRRIKNKNTKPELIVRKYLFSKGLRYRINDKRYPGHPDMVFPKYKTVVFVNGCFWHMHDSCKVFHMPKSNPDYWLPKLERNRARDLEKYGQLDAMGWNVIVVWECELRRSNREATLNKLYQDITHEHYSG